LDDPLWEEATPFLDGEQSLELVLQFELLGAQVGCIYQVVSFGFCGLGGDRVAGRKQGAQVWRDELLHGAPLAAGRLPGAAWWPLGDTVRAASIRTSATSSGPEEACRLGCFASPSCR